MIRIAFRLDDLAQTSDHALENGIIEQLVDHNLVASFAVEPFTNSPDGAYPISPDKILHLIEASREGVIEIAMHGFTHEERNVLPNGNPSEFAGIEESEQYNLVQKGVSNLQDIFEKTIHGFVPPWNSYDRNTLQALERCGISYMSAGWGPLVQYRGKLPILPSTCNLSHVQDAVTNARRFRRLHPVILVIMHHYDFEENNTTNSLTTLEEFGNLLSWINLQDDLQVQTMVELATTISSKRSRSIFNHWNWKRRLHWRLQAYFPGYCFTSITSLQAITRAIRGSNN